MKCSPLLKSHAQYHYVLLFKTPTHGRHVLFRFNIRNPSSNVVRLLCSKSSSLLAMRCFCPKTLHQEVHVFFLSRDFSSWNTDSKGPPNMIYPLSVKTLGCMGDVLFLSGRITPNLHVFFLSLGLLAEYKYIIIMEHWMLSLFKKHPGDYTCRVCLEIHTHGYMFFSASEHLFLGLKTQKRPTRASCCSVKISFIYVFMCCASIKFDPKNFYVLFVLKKRSMETDTNILPHSYCVWFCSVSAPPKKRYLSGMLYLSNPPPPYNLSMDIFSKTRSSARHVPSVF